jgi:hypothetical protein
MARVIPSLHRTPLGGAASWFCVNDWLDGYPRAMSVLNKRNAVLGWAVWNVSKKVAKQKAKSATSSDDGLPKKSAVAAGIAALGGALWFWRRRAGSGDD